MHKLVPLPLVSGRKTVVAHRGQTVNGPHQNTLPAFKRAVEVGADMVEFDVWRTRDGVLVINHGGFIRGRRLSTLSYSELSAWEHGSHVTTVEEVFELLAGRAWPYLELKQGGYEAEVVALARQYFQPNEFALVSFYDPIVRELKRVAPDVCVGLGIGETHFYQLIKQPMSDAWPWGRLMHTGADFLSYSCILEPFGIAQRMAERGMQLTIWGLNDEARVHKYLHRTSAPVVLTDVPELVLEQVQKGSAEGPAVPIS